MTLKELKEQIEKLEFNTSYLDDCYDVKFNNDGTISLEQILEKPHKAFYSDSTFDVPHSIECSCNIGYDHKYEDRPL